MEERFSFFLGRLVGVFLGFALVWRSSDYGLAARRTLSLNRCWTAAVHYIWDASSGVQLFPTSEY